MPKGALEKIYDVIVVGAGPAGTAAAKRCAENGLNTLILEKCNLPRHKICGGMVMGPLAHDVIKQEFGEIPEAVLAKPAYLVGYEVHVPGMGSRKLDHPTPIAWRKHLDFWMNQTALAKGVHLWQGARVVDIAQAGQGFFLKVEKNKEQEKLRTKYLVGADGVFSTVRRILFPELKITYRQAYQEGYRGELDLDKWRYHWFFSTTYAPPFFSVHQKDDHVVINVSGDLGQAIESINLAKHFLAERYGFDISQKPVWRDSCVEFKLHDDLVSHAFIPAKGNALLVGDAASFILPVSGEGIGTAIRSGLIAGNSILEAFASGKQADGIYAADIEPVIAIIKKLDPWSKKMREEIGAATHSVAQVIRDAYDHSLQVI